MSEASYSKVAKMAVTTSMDIKPQEQVTVVTDLGRLKLGEALAKASRGLGNETITVVMQPRKMHGNEPPKAVAAIMKASDVVLTATTYALTHTASRLAATKAGARILIMRGVTEEMLDQGAMTADYGQVKQITDGLGRILDSARVVHVTSPSGTDVTFSIEGRNSLKLSGVFNWENSFAILPDGEVAIAPVEGSANGKIVFDYSIDGVGLLKKPVSLTIRKGIAEKIEGGEEAEKFIHILSEGGENTRNLAEFAIGTNPKARLIGVLAEDKKYLGSVHFALGDNHTIGGVVRSGVHLDGMVLKPTIVVDGRKTIDSGKLP